MNVTKSVIEQAVLELCRSLPFDRIKVRDICEKAGVSKQTFYNHFKDKYEVVACIYLQDVNEETVLKEGYSYNLLVKDLNNIWERRDFYRNVLSGDGQNSLFEFVKRHSVESVSKTLCAKWGRKLTREEKYYISFMTYGWVGNMLDWLKGDFDFSVEKFAEIESSAIPGFITKTLEGK